MPKVRGEHKSSGGTIKQRAMAARGQASAFESASVGRKRHTVIGAPRNHTGGNARTASQARARSDQIRRETLLIEHQQKGRTNAFVDNRFGEADEGMPLEDKLVHRFQRERQRQLKASKASRYSLGDDDGAYDDAAGGTQAARLGRPRSSRTVAGPRRHGGSLGCGPWRLDEEAGRGRRDDGFEGADFVKRALWQGRER